MVQEYMEDSERGKKKPTWATQILRNTYCICCPNSLRMSSKNVQICVVHQAVVPTARSRLPQFLRRFAKELSDWNLATLWSARRWKMSKTYPTPQLTWPEGICSVFANDFPWFSMKMTLSFQLAISDCPWSLTARGCCNRSWQPHSNPTSPKRASTASKGVCTRRFVAFKSSTFGADINFGTCFSCNGI